jgi:hypothetical protein
MTVSARLPARPATLFWLSFVPDDSPDSESDLLYFVSGLRAELALAALLLLAVSNVTVPQAFDTNQLKDWHLMPVHDGLASIFSRRAVQRRGLCVQPQGTIHVKELFSSSKWNKIAWTLAPWRALAVNTLFVQDSSAPASSVWR